MATHVSGKIASLHNPKFRIPVKWRHSPLDRKEMVGLCQSLRLPPILAVAIPEPFFCPGNAMTG